MGLCLPVCALCPFMCPYFGFLRQINFLFLFASHSLFPWQSLLTVIVLVIKISCMANLYLACLPDREFHLLEDLSWTAINNSVRSQVVMSNYGDECQLNSWLTAEGQHAADTQSDYWSQRTRQDLNRSISLCLWASVSGASTVHCPHSDTDAEADHKKTLSFNKI